MNSLCSERSTALVVLFIPFPSCCLSVIVSIANGNGEEYLLKKSGNTHLSLGHVEEGCVDIEVIQNAFAAVPNRKVGVDGELTGDDTTSQGFNGRGSNYCRVVSCWGAGVCQIPVNLKHKIKEIHEENMKMFNLPQVLSF